MKKVLKIILWIILVPVAIFIVFLVFSTIDDYNPDEKVNVYINENVQVFSKDTFTIMNWNIGYCGMDESIDFFYDGGTQARVSEERTINNISEISDYLAQNTKNVDFILLQEIDIKAKRSYKINQLESINNVLPNFYSFFGKNYDVAFIPVPVSKPYGQVLAGINTYSKDEPTEVNRYQYPGNFSWPTKLFMLDRCFLVNRYKVKNNKELLIINLHNSAFDDGSLRAQQLNYLNKFITKEYENGNYIIVGGDWNQRPPKFEPFYDDEEYIYNNDRSPIISDSIFPADWKFIYQSSIPTNRDANVAWNKKTVPVTTIDFFLISPNMDCLDVHGDELNFKNSDHQPVIATFFFKD